MKRDLSRAGLCLDSLAFPTGKSEGVPMDWRKAGCVILSGISAISCIDEQACEHCQEDSCTYAKQSALTYKTLDFIEEAERLCPGFRWIGDLEATYTSLDGRDHQVPISYPRDVLNDGFVDTSDLRRFFNHKTPADVAAILVDLFGVPALPSSVPTVVDPNVLQGDRLKAFLPEYLSETVAVDVYNDEVEFPQSSLYMPTWHTVYTPNVPPSRVVILIQGHDNEYLTNEAVYFLEQGSAVILRAMPGFLDDYFIVSAGHRFDGGHDGLYALESDDFNPMALFIEPNIQAVNLASALFPEAKIDVVGLSGGGLMALLIQAFDDRVDVSVSVSGWKPFFLRYRAGLVGFEGDYEQNASRFYMRHSINYLDLVVLATRGEKRHYQVWVQGDTSAFGGDGYRLYADQLSHITGGGYRVILDLASVGHRIERAHLEAVAKMEAFPTPTRSDARYPAPSSARTVE